MEGRGRLKEHRMLLIWYEVHVNKPHACLSFLTLLYQNIFSIKIRSLFFRIFPFLEFLKVFVTLGHLDYFMKYEKLKEFVTQ